MGISITGSSGGGTAANGLTAVNAGEVTAITGNTPAFDGQEFGVAPEQREYIVTLETVNDINADFDWNKSVGWAWDDAVDSLNMTLTINWDNDPGQNIDFKYTIYRPEDTAFAGGGIV